ncbi:YqkE family protein [Paenibacillus fonticola]|uniref:YqkE family protein n=1 Tax=Paenibacillus fonticola TaxID=379896 RepID=UPI00035E69CB|nr:YqkE family protein [Paenibacillus fonticola]
MAKRRNTQPSAASASDKPATLKDLLGADTVSKLKQQAESLKREEEERKAAVRKQAEEARKAEKKRLENDFEYLLNNSDMDWNKYK